MSLDQKWSAAEGKVSTTKIRYKKWAVHVLPFITFIIRPSDKDRILKREMVQRAACGWRCDEIRPDGQRLCASAIRATRGITRNADTYLSK